MQLLVNDEEHARMVLEASAGQESKAPSGPPMATWSAEVEALTNIADEVRALRYVTTAVNSKNKPKPPVPYARPKTAFERVRNQQREQRHRELVARVLPHKRK